MTDATAYAKLAEDYAKLAREFRELLEAYDNLLAAHRKLTASHGELSNEYCSLARRHNNRFVADEAVEPLEANAADNQPSGGEVSRDQANGQLQHGCDDGQGQVTVSHDADQPVKKEEAL